MYSVNFCYVRKTSNFDPRLFESLDSHNLLTFSEGKNPNFQFSAYSLFISNCQVISFLGFLSCRNTKYATSCFGKRRERSGSTTTIEHAIFLLVKKNILDVFVGPIVGRFYWREIITTLSARFIYL